METTFRFGADASELQSVMTTLQGQFQSLNAIAAQSGDAMADYGQGTRSAADQAELFGQRMQRADTNIQTLNGQLAAQQTVAKAAQDALAQLGDKADASARQQIKAETDKVDQLEAALRQQTAVSDAAAKAEMTAQKSQINEEIALTEGAAVRGEISETEKSAKIAQLRQAEDQAQIEYYGHRLQLYQNDEKARIQAESALSSAVSKANTDRINSDTQATQARITAWQQTLKPIDRAIDQSVTGIITGTKTTQQAINGLARSMVASGVAAAESWLSKQVATQLALTQTTKTQSAIRDGVNASESSSFLGRLGTMASSWLGLETEKTSSTVVGEGARTTVTQTGAETKTAVETQQTSESVALSAGRGAAGTYADACAELPYGWLIGGGLAAASFAAIKGFSAAGGWDRVPYDGAMTELHKDEMVLPASIAGPLRSMTQAAPAYGLPSGVGGPLSGGALAGGGTVGGDTHHHFSPTTHITVNNQGSRALTPDQVGDAVQAALRNGHAGLVKQIRAMR